MVAEPHAYDVPPQDVASRIATSPSDRVAMPQPSTFASRRSCGRWRNLRMKPVAMMPTGMPAKNSQRQPKWSVMTPPASGPATDVTPKTAPIRPWYLPRCRGGMMSPMMVCDRGMIVPMPSPWMARAATRTQKPWARPATSEPSMKTTRPAM